MHCALRLLHFADKLAAAAFSAQPDFGLPPVAPPVAKRVQDRPDVHQHADQYDGQRDDDGEQERVQHRLLRLYAMRTASVAPGKFTEAMAWAHEMATYIEKKCGCQYRVSVPIGGNPYRIRWTTELAGLTELGELLSKLSGDQHYPPMLKQASDLFMATSSDDEIWQIV